MKHGIRFLLCLCVLTTLTLPGHAVLVGPYPGLDNLIKDADVIAVVRVESVPSGLSIDGWHSVRCFVCQTLKDDLKTDEDKQTTITFNDWSSAKNSNNAKGLGIDSVHLVFLYRAESDANRVMTLTNKGADMTLSPLGNETKPAGKTLKAQIQTLLARYKIYRDEQIKREDAILEEALKDRATDAEH